MYSAAPTSTDFDELIGYLPVLYTGGFEPVLVYANGNKTDEDVVVMSCPKYEEAVTQFFSAASRECWSDSKYASKNISAMICDPEKVACATLQEIKSMLTWCVRGERFCDGHWGEMIKGGQVHNLLQRLKELRQL